MPSAIRLVDPLMIGAGLSVCARERWSALGVPPELRFADALSIAELRRAKPGWRPLALAPVTLVCDPTLLDAVEPDSVDYLLAFHLFHDLERLAVRIEGAARVLRSGGSLIVPVTDGSGVPPESAGAGAVFETLARLEAGPAREPAPGNWTLARFTGLIASLEPLFDGAFDLELVGREGREMLAVFSRRLRSVPATGTLLAHDGRIYVVDDGKLRHVGTLAVLDRIRRPDQPIEPLAARAFDKFVKGRALNGDAVDAFLARRAANG